MIMGMPRKELIDELEKALSINELSVFIGAGLSKGAGHYDWKGLLEKPALKLNLDVSKEYDLISLAQYYCNQEGRAKINQLIREAFPKTLPVNKNYELLAKLPIDTYWTTNYDQLIENSLIQNKREHLVITRDKDLHLQSKKYDAIIYKMHGDIDDPDNAVLTRDDYERYGITDRTLFKDVLEGHLITNTFMFLGFSFSDPNFNFILGKLKALSNGNTRPHYCFIKKVQEVDFLIEEDGNRFIDIAQFDYEKVKQKLVIEDLKKRYNIETFLMDSYEDITSVLNDIYNRYRKKKIFISGSADRYSPMNEEEAKKLISRLAFSLVGNGYHIVSGYGKGIGSYVIDGVAEYCYSSKNKKISDYLTLMPFPLSSITKASLKETWSKYREEMISSSGVVLTMFGNKKEGDNLLIADGMIEEVDLANKFGLDIITLNFTGGAAKEIGNQEEFSVIKIEEFIDVETNVKEIIEIIDKLNKRR
ncbi:MAG: hypothetical protein GX219_10300 [Tissierellia bacterium]|nr:hypothetical protein [Tissierellia bacterium]